MTGPRAKISVAIKILLNGRIESEFESATVSLTEEIPSERQGFATFRQSRRRSRTALLGATLMAVLLRLLVVRQWH